MSQILIKRSAVAAKVPATTDLALGELAINTYDGKLYLKKSVGGTETVIQVGDPKTSPVQSIFGRTGDVTLQSSDVTTALTFTPVNKAGDTMTGPLTATGFTGPLTGNASTATTLQTTRSISATGDATWTVNFNGSANATAALTLAASGVVAGTYNSVTVDAKGRVTGASNISATTQLGYTPVNKAGDGMTGQLGLWGSRFYESTATAGIHAQNSDIIGVNGLYFEDNADGIGEGLNFYRDATHWDTLYMTGGSLFIQRNRTHNTVGTNDTVLHSANFNTYAPTLTGTGASGAWAISAATLTTGRTIAMTGDLTWTTPAFNGSANVTAVGTLANSGVTAGTYTKLTVDAKGRATAGTQLTASDVTTALGYVPSSSASAGAPNGAATLDANGKLLASQVPAIAISDTFVVASQSAMLALSSADVGDIAIRTDLSKSFILKASGYSTLANWQELLTPVDVVTSVAGKTGAVSLTVSDISGAQASLGFTPVQQNGGTGQLSNKVYIGWRGGDLGLQVDSTNFGATWPIGVTGTASNVTGTIALANGGTGATTAVGALGNLGALGVVNSNLGNNVDFNSMTTTGIYYQTGDAAAATATNAPIGLAGKLTVTNSGNTIGIWQSYDTYRVSSTPRQFRRQYCNGGWSPWVESSSSANGSTVNPTTPKDGDVQVAAGPTISIYASGAWRQIFPAVYS